MQVDSGEDNYVIETENEEEAYQKIEKELGIKPVKLMTLPTDAKFAKAELEKDLKVAELYYQINNENIVYIINGDQAKNSIGVSVEDKIIEDYTMEVNRTLIHIKGCETPSTKQKRYYASFDYKKTKYFLSGVLEQEELEKILKNLYFPKKLR